MTIVREERAADQYAAPSDLRPIPEPSPRRAVVRLQREAALMAAEARCAYVEGDAPLARLRQSGSSLRYKLARTRFRCAARLGKWA